MLQAEPLAEPEAAPRPGVVSYSEEDYAALVLDERRICRGLRDYDLLHYGEVAAAALAHDEPVSWLGPWMRARLEASRAEWRWRNPGPVSAEFRGRYRDWLRAAKERVSLEDVIALHYPAVPNGRRQWQVACPLHQDRDPSLSVDGERGLWYCHACMVGGDVLEWWKLVEGLDWAATLRRLEELSGLERPVERALKPLSKAVIEHG